jgi:hypothetical protein
MIRIDKLIQFCDLTPDQAIRDYIALSFDPARATGRSTEVDLAELADLTEWIEPTMQWIGYTTRTSSIDQTR